MIHQHHTRGLTRDDSTSENAPAHVAYVGADRAVVTHPLGFSHENAILARRRLARRGYTITDEKGVVIMLPEGNTDPGPGELDAARIRLEAAAALNAVNCKSVELFLPAIEQRLRIEPTTRALIVLDDDGAPRRGLTVLQLAREVRKAYEKAPGRFFG